MTLQYIRCEGCDSTILVGIVGRDVRNTPRSSGVYEDSPFIAIDKPSIENSPKILTFVDCPKCGKECKVRNMSDDSVTEKYIEKQLEEKGLVEND